jgi:hypothetical protein
MVIRVHVTYVHYLHYEKYLTFYQELLDFAILHVCLVEFYFSIWILCDSFFMVRVISLAVS